MGTRIGAPLECDFEWRRGDTKSFAIRLTQNGTVLSDVTGYSALLTLNTIGNPTDTSQQVFQASAAPNSPANDGLLVFDMDGMEGSPEVPPANYYYDIEVTDPAGKKDTRMVGRFNVKQDITKP